VQLRVTDNNGATDTDTLLIEIRFADVAMVDDEGWPGISYLSLAIIGGNPAIAYQEGNADDLKYVRATDSTGDSWGTPVPIISIGNVGIDVSLQEVNGRPAIAYIDGGDDIRVAGRSPGSMAGQRSTPAARTGDPRCA
jgi:hypothetical protein